MSAVSCELFQTSSAWTSGESSSPTAAWIPPCAFAELHDCREPLVARATRAPARSAATADARPEAPLPITSTSNRSACATAGLSHPFSNATHIVRLFNSPPRQADKWLDGTGFRLCLHARRACDRRLSDPEGRSGHGAHVPAGAAGRGRREPGECVHQPSAGDAGTGGLVQLGGHLRRRGVGAAACLRCQARARGQVLLLHRGGL